MTDEQRKQIEKKYNVFARECHQNEYSGVTKANTKHYYLGGAEFGLSLADNRVKELEEETENLKIALRRMITLAKDKLAQVKAENVTLSFVSIIDNSINEAEKLLTPTNNDKEQKG